jgi:hypothetical protein
MGYNKQLVCLAVFNSYHFKQKSDPELPMIRNYHKHCIFIFFINSSVFIIHIIKVLIKKWLRYQRVISLEKQVGITSQRNKWASKDPRIYRRWDQAPRRSKHPLSTSLNRLTETAQVILCNFDMEISANSCKAARPFTK